MDTSVLFAGSLSSSGFARDLIIAGARGDLEIVLSQFVILETRRNLAKKAPHGLSFFEVFLASDSVQSIEPPATLVRQVGTVIALKDAPVVAGAVHSMAQFVATYDRKHLLSQARTIREQFGIIVETPEAVLKRLG